MAQITHVDSLSRLLYGSEVTPSYHEQAADTGCLYVDACPATSSTPMSSMWAVSEGSGGLWNDSFPLEALLWGGNPSHTNNNSIPSTVAAVGEEEDAEEEVDADDCFNRECERVRRELAACHALEREVDGALAFDEPASTASSCRSSCDGLRPTSFPSTSFPSSTGSAAAFNVEQRHLYRGSPLKDAPPTAATSCASSSPSGTASVSASVSSSTSSSTSTSASASIPSTSSSPPASTPNTRTTSPPAASSSSSPSASSSSPPSSTTSSSTSASPSTNPISASPLVKRRPPALQLPETPTVQHVEGLAAEQLRALSADEEPNIFLPAALPHFPSSKSLTTTNGIIGNGHGPNASCLWEQQSMQMLLRRSSSGGGGGLGFYSAPTTPTTPSASSFALPPPFSCTPRPRDGFLVSPRGSLKSPRNNPLASPRGFPLSAGGAVIAGWGEAAAKGNKCPPLSPFPLTATSLSLPSTPIAPPRRRSRSTTSLSLSIESTRGAPSLPTIFSPALVA